MPARGRRRRRHAARSPGWRASSSPRTPTSDQRAQAAVAIAGAQSSLLAVAFAIQDVADAGGPLEVRSSADALQRAALQLEDLLAALAPAPA